jgi:hypothetical protein
VGEVVLHGCALVLAEFGASPAVYSWAASHTPTNMESVKAVTAVMSIQRTFRVSASGRGLPKSRHVHSIEQLSRCFHGLGSRTIPAAAIALLHQFTLL